MDARYVHKIKLSDLKIAAKAIVGSSNAQAYKMKIEKDVHNTNAMFHFKLTLTVYHKNRTSNIKYEYYSDTKVGLLMNMLDLKDINEFDRETFNQPMVFGF
jgi:hypothetical protein